MPVALHLLKDGKDAKSPKSSPGQKRLRTKEKEPFAQEPKEAPAEPQPEPVGKGRRLLVVDDNQVVLKAFQNKLEADGFNVVTTSNAASVASTAEENRAELIILDINFPPSGGMEWNGFTIMQWVRRFPELARLPVIIITGSELAQHKQQALASGVVAFFEKPVDYQQLRAAVLKALPPAK